ncbi:MAG: hypothetical protein HQK99_09770 [Nitrospirae bacterium]|nr:hypothetical protein [Nitrospirota bacterium]
MAVQVITQQAPNPNAAALKAGKTQQQGNNQNPTGGTGAVGTAAGQQQGPAAIINISTQAREAANATQKENTGATGAAGTAGTTGAAGATAQVTPNNQQGNELAPRNPKEVAASFFQSI